MANNNTISIHGFTSNSMAHCESKGLGKCLLAYASNCSGETIESIGFNPNSGYTYIALENGILICSSMGQDVDYLVTNADDDEEVFLDDYEEAINYKFEAEEE